MGHMIQGFIGNECVINEIILPLVSIKPVIIDLSQGLKLLFLTEDVFDSIHEFSNNLENNNGVQPFEFLDQAIISYLEKIRPKGCFIYIETDYCGGIGSQSSGVFENGQLMSSNQECNEDLDFTILYPERLLNSPINTALRVIGVIRNTTLDEFDTLGLVKYRDMPNDEV